MSTASPVELKALNGANPLAFLAALGTLVTLHDAGEANVRVGWKATTSWIPVLQGLAVTDPDALTCKLAEALRGRTIPPDSESRCESAQKDFELAKRALKAKQDEVKKQKLKGKASQAIREAEVAPLREAMHIKRSVWLMSLKQAVPSPELALGKHIDCTPSEYREHASSFVKEANVRQRQSVDLLAAFGSDACSDNNRIAGTPFCFITGSGHQYFLETARLLMAKVDATLIRQALFEPWNYRDETLSMRWDPLEDRRYALMDRDPTASDNKSRTVWMANLLAYRSLVLFPCVPTARALGTTAWNAEKNSEATFTWPIWEGYLNPDTIRSLLQLSHLQENPLDRPHLRARGIAAVFRSRRIRVGKYINFTPAERI